MNNLFITGNPGVGKTRLIVEATLPYRDKIGGFFTEEIRKGGQRWGFRIKDFEGQEGILAHKGMKSEYKLNKYGIDRETLEKIAVSAMDEAWVRKEIIVIDEIGSMECISEKFCQTLLKCLQSSKKILATIRKNSQPFTDQIKNFPDTEIIELTRENFLECKEKVRRFVESAR